MGHSKATSTTTCSYCEYDLNREDEGHPTASAILRSPCEKIATSVSHRE